MSKTLKILVLASQKGGAGKTTLAAHIATAAEDAGERVAMLDLDPQGTLRDWWAKREAEAPALADATFTTVPDKLDQLAEAGYTLAVVDTPPAANAAIGKVLARADLVLMPVKPSPNDLHAVGATVDIAERAGASFALAINEADKRAAITAQAAAALSAHGTVCPAIIASRVGFRVAMIDGRTLPEMEPRNPGAGEVKALTLWLVSQLRPSKKKAKEAV